MVAADEGHVSVVKLLLSKGANIHSQVTIDGVTCLALAHKSKELKFILSNWAVTMLIIVLQDLLVLSGLDPSSFIDLRQYMGSLK